MHFLLTGLQNRNPPSDGRRRLFTFGLFLPPNIFQDAVKQRCEPLIRGQRVKQFHKHGGQRVGPELDRPTALRTACVVRVAPAISSGCAPCQTRSTRGTADKYRKGEVGVLSGSGLTMLTFA